MAHGPALRSLQELTERQQGLEEQGRIQDKALADLREELHQVKHGFQPSGEEVKAFPITQGVS